MEIISNTKIIHSKNYQGHKIGQIQYSGEISHNDIRESMLRILQKFIVDSSGAFAHLILFKGIQRQSTKVGISTK